MVLTSSPKTMLSQGMNIVKKLPSYKQGNFVPTCPRTKSQCTYEKKPEMCFFAKNQGELSFVQPNIFLKKYLET